MKKSIIIFVFLLGFIFTNINASDKKSFTLPEYEKIVLQNGLTVYLMENKEVPLITINMVINAGAFEEGGNYGLSYAVSEALLFGTKSFSKSQIEEEFDFRGASLRASANKEYVEISTNFINDDFDDLISIFKEVITSPKFPEEEIEKWKNRHVSVLKQAKESPGSVISNYFSKFLYGNHPYGNPVTGTTETISKLTNEQIKEFYNANYIPSASALIIVGDIDKDEMKTKIEAIFGDWNSTVSHHKVPALEEYFGFDKNRVLLVNKNDSQETTFYIGQFGIDRKNRDYIPIMVVNTILGGRFTSWLNDELRVNSGLTYGARSFFNRFNSSGLFAIYSFTRTETAIEALDLALEVLNRLHTQGIDEETLTSAKNYIKGQFPPDYETSSRLANLLAEMFVYDFDESFINDFEKNVDGLTLEKSKEIISKYFPSKNLQFVLIGKAEELRDKISKYGEVTEKEILSEGF